MKKLKKLNLNSFVEEEIRNSELKQIIGGSGVACNGGGCASEASVDKALAAMRRK